MKGIGWNLPNVASSNHDEAAEARVRWWSKITHANGWQIFIVQRIIVKKWLDRSLSDKSIKFGIVVAYSIKNDISYDAKQNRSKIWYFGVKQ